MTSISLSLISHTNAGKTTLARTLLARDVGEVRDAPHVTEFAEDYPLIESAQGDVLTLWDTPGFGDSVRLVKRLRGGSNPLGWFLSEVWDRFRDRAFHATQQAMRNVRDRADVVLYLVNAAEPPEQAAYIASEMELLEWLGKPVVVLLNQLGEPREAAVEQAEVDRWKRHLSAFSPVRRVLPLDAFTRCWAQEFVLLAAVEDVLPGGEPRVAMTRLREAWQARRIAAFDASMAELAHTLAAVAAMREPLPDSGGVRGTLRQMGSAVGSMWKQATGDEPAGELPAQAQAAQRALARRAEEAVSASTARLLALHGLDGRAQGELDALIASHFEMKLHVNEGKAALVGGAVSGALGGLIADVGSAGMTLGGGMLTGAVLGALAAASAAHGVNVLRGRKASWLTWSPEAMDAMVEAALLRYLAVAHFGRGRGAWTRGDAPAHWRAQARVALSGVQANFTRLWAARPQGDEADRPLDHAALQASVNQATWQLLMLLYPGALPARGFVPQGEPAASPPTAPPSHPANDTSAPWVKPMTPPVP